MALSRLDVDQGKSSHGPAAASLTLVPRRHILATTSQLQETVRCLEARISQLEEALAQSHAMHSSSPHPLLQDHSTQAHTPPAPSSFTPVQGHSSSPSATIPSTSPPAYSPQPSTYTIDNHGSNGLRVHPSFTDVSRSATDEWIKSSRHWMDVPQSYDPIELPQSSISSAGDASSSSSVEFPPFVPSYTTSNMRDMRAGILPQGSQQDRVPGPPEPELLYMYPYYTNQWP